MGREVRRVPKDWQHPKDERSDDYKPLLGSSYSEDAADFMKMANEKGLQEAVDYHGQAPDQNDYMPEWSAAERTHLMMYEDTTEGTPISPAFETPEQLARWLTDNNASAFGGSTASYEGWLRVCNGGYAPSAIMTISADGSGTMQSGVDALT
jgi:hypothetical protein